MRACMRACKHVPCGTQHTNQRETRNPKPGGRYSRRRAWGRCGSGACRLLRSCSTTSMTPSRSLSLPPTPPHPPPYLPPSLTLCLSLSRARCASPHRRVGAHTHARARAHTYTRTHARMHARTHAHTHTRMHAHTHAHALTHSITLSHMPHTPHTHIHAHAHAHARTGRGASRAAGVATDVGLSEPRPAPRAGLRVCALSPPRTQTSAYTYTHYKSTHTHYKAIQPGRAPCFAKHGARVSRPRGTGSVGDSVGEGATETHTRHGM